LIARKTVQVYVGGGHSFRTMYPAYRSAAWRVVMKHCYCDVDVEDGIGAQTLECRYHSNGGVYGQRVVSRLVRLWILRDKAPPSVYRLACKYKENDWGNVPLPEGTRSLFPKRQNWKFLNQVAALRELARRYPEEYKDLIDATAVEEELRT
jgi:hypothetical protein